MSKETAMALASTKNEMPGVVETQPVAEQPSQDIKKEDAPTKELKDERKELASAEFARLAKKEADLVRKELQAKEIIRRGQEFDELVKNNKLEALLKLGFTEESLFEALASKEVKNPTPQEVAEETAKKIVEEKLRAIEEAEAKKRFEEQRVFADKTIQSYKSDLLKATSADPVGLELVNHYGNEAQELAYILTEEIIKDSGGADVPSPKEILAMIEEHYFNQLQETLKLSKLKPFVALDQKQPVAREQSPKPDAVSPPAETKELESTEDRSQGSRPNAPAVTRRTSVSNRGAPSVASLARAAQETRDQKKQRLIEMIRQSGLTK